MDHILNGDPDRYAEAIPICAAASHNQHSLPILYGIYSVDGDCYCGTDLSRY